MPWAKEAPTPASAAVPRVEPVAEAQKGRLLVWATTRKDWLHW